jgi:hypothetical protein
MASAAGHGGIERGHRLLDLVQEQLPVGHRHGAVDVVRDHHRRGAQLVAQLQDQRVQARRVGRAQARAGFVQKQQRRAQRQRRALAHAATQFGRHLVDGLFHARQKR